MTRTRIVLSSLAATLLLAATPARAEPALYEIDPEHFSIGFMTLHLGYEKVLGQFLEAGGSFRYDEATNEVSDIKVTIESDSVFSNHDRRDDHLRSDQFLNVEDFPEITFVGTSAEATGEASGTVTGDLTIIGETHPVTLQVTRNKIGKYPINDNYVVGISVRGTVKRSEYGMMYAVENGWVGDEVEVIIEFEAIRQ